MKNLFRFTFFLSLTCLMFSGQSCNTDANTDKNKENADSTKQDSSISEEPKIEIDKKYNDVARILAGMEIESSSAFYPVTQTSSWKAYKKNADAGWAAADERRFKALRSWAEAELAELAPDEKVLLLSEYGLGVSGLDQLIKVSYRNLNLITYFTAGVEEVRAWTVQQGTKAPQAAGVIHSDFERGFIKAEVIKLADYQQYKSELACREAGRIKMEGKDYVVADGDIMHFRFNV